MGGSGGHHAFFANKDRCDGTASFGSFNRQRAEVLLETLEANGLANHTVHADMTVKRSGLGTDSCSHCDNVSVTVGSKDAIFAGTNATSALDTVEIGHLNIHEDEVKDLGAQKLECLESAVKADRRTS